MQWFAVGCGGFVGAIARYALSTWVVRKFPAGTLVVNLVGCLLIGLLMALCVKAKWPGDGTFAHRFLIAGFLGSLTTFSTFSYQTVELAHRGQYKLAVLNIVLNLVCGLIAVLLGIALGEAIATRWNVP
ncbi:MAG: fluoride efflux transporter CrcB [Planctomycetaceae bacterium]|nr:fluoride efflux transporter CrcB [Planctomycetaceae bacterium]